ncbi:MAG TPA: sulfotransferase [Acidimicrobiales bacterium]|nr:sulfotransferase [Acidimicrobiales bacterium]
MSDRGPVLEELVAEAAARAGAAPEVLPPTFVSTLGLLLASCRGTARLTPTGWSVVRRAALRHLRNLAYLAAHVAAHPEVTAHPLGTPLVVTGMPRTGTTLLHNLLALDPDHRVLHLWQALHPVPPGPGGPSPAELRAQAESWLAAFHRLVPEFRAIHATTAEGPEECDALLQNTFASQHFDDMFDARDYAAWLATAGLHDEYRHYARQLRVLSAGVGAPGAGGAGGPAAGRTWALKSPSHLGHLDALLDALPGATVALCHREPRQAVASYASLILAVRRPHTDAVDPAVLGAQALSRSATAMTRALAVRAVRPERFVDVSYPELVRAPIGAVRRLYGDLGRALDPRVEDRMGRWLAANPQHKHGPHRYALEDFGLDPERVDEAFAAYRVGFGAATR